MNETHPSIEAIVDYLHGELPPLEQTSVRAHFATCSSCDERRLEEIALTQALRAHLRAQERELPRELVERIRRKIDRPRLFSPWYGLRPAFAIPAAAAVAAIVYFGMNTWRHEAPAPVAMEPAAYVDNHAAMAATAPFADDAPPSVMLTSNDEAR